MVSKSTFTAPPAPEGVKVFAVNKALKECMETNDQ